MLRFVRWGLFLFCALIALTLLGPNSPSDGQLPSHPDQDPAFAEIASDPVRSSQAQFMPETELEQQYSAALIEYGRQRVGYDYEVADIARRKNKRFGLLTVFVIFWGIALLPWPRWFSKAKSSAEVVADHAVVLAAKGSEAWREATASSPVIGRHGLKSYSVADELLKWSKLRDEGVVTEAEYEEARVKLLSR
jgi:hypothetical protein